MIVSSNLWILSMNIKKISIYSDLLLYPSTIICHFSIKVLHVLLEFTVSKVYCICRITFLLYFLIGLLHMHRNSMNFLSWPLSAFLSSLLIIYFSGYFHGKEFLEDFAGGPLVKTLSQCRGSRFDPWWGN